MTDDYAHQRCIWFVIAMYTRYGSVVVDIVDTGIPCCRCIAEVSGRAEGADYGGAIHRGREVALGGESGALPWCHQLLRPCNVPACPSRDADDSQGRSFPPPSLCTVSIVLFYPRSLYHSFSVTLTFSLSFSFTASLGVASPFFPPWLVFVVETGRHDGKAEVNFGRPISPDLAHVSGPSVRDVHAETLTPPISAIERKPGEIYERYTERRLDDREVISTSRAVLSKCRKNIRARRHVSSAARNARTDAIDVSASCFFTIFSIFFH